VAEPGSCVAGALCEEPWLIARGADGVLRAFANVCRHHAAELLAPGAHCVDELVCPYHGWTYGLDGGLQSAPGMGAMQDFARADFGLRPLAVTTWGPLLFLSWDPAPPPLLAGLAELDRELEADGWGALRHAASRRYEMDCNWKVFADNYLDGGYHIAHLHPGLDGQLDMGDYRTELAGPGHSVQRCASAGERAAFHGRDFAGRIGAGACYAWIHPNLAINRYGPILDTNRLLPTGPESCEVVFDFWFPADADAHFVAASLEASEEVQRQDQGICASVQRGLRSRAYDRGRYAPSSEAAALHFHRRLAADLRAAMAGA